MKIFISQSLLAVLLLLLFGPAWASVDTLPGNYEGTLNCGGFLRSYTVHVPPHYRKGKAMPLVLLFHGAGGNGRQILHATGWDKKADAAGFLVVAPDAERLAPLAPESDDNPTAWQETLEHTGTVAPLSPDPTGQDSVNDIGFVQALLDDLPHRYSVDTKRIYATGFSSGGVLTWRLALLLSTRLTACAPVSGLSGRVMVRPQRIMPLLFVIGLADDVFPFRGGFVDVDGQKVRRSPVLGTVAAWAAVQGFSPRYRVRQQHTQPVKGDGVTILDYGSGKGSQMTAVYLVAGVSHEYPNTKQFNATNIIWSFFQQQTLP